MAYRVDKIVQKVLRGLGDEAQHGITRDVILNEMDAVQLELARDYYAIKGKFTVSLIAGTSIYTAPGTALALVPFADMALNVPAGTSKILFAGGAYASTDYRLDITATDVGGGMAGFDSITKAVDGFTITNLSGISNVEYTLTPYYDNMFSSNTSSFVVPSTLYKIKEFIEPATWCHRIEVLSDSNVFVRNSRLTYISTYPKWAYFWNGEMLLTPAPTVSESLTVLCYLIPSTELADGNDPEVGAEYDDCLEWETLSRFNGNERLHQRYVEKALQNGRENAKEAVAGVITVESFTDGLGY